MHWRCGVCDHVINEELKNIHLQSRFHKRLSTSNIRKYIISNPEPNKYDDIIRQYLILHDKKSDKFEDILSVELKIQSNQGKNVRRQYPCPSNQERIIITIFF